MSEEAPDDAHNLDPEIKVITTQFGTIAGKGLVPPGTKTTVRKSAFSSEWMIHDATTADDVMEIDPKLRYHVNLSEMSNEELKTLMASMNIKTQKRMMRRDDMERLIKSRLVQIADDEEE